MRILITNDDGINAPGLEVLTGIANQLAGTSGEVWTVAPAFEQSGVGHCISYTRPMMIAKLEAKRYAAEGSPADCVLAGLYDVMKTTKPDLVLSGVNRGNNSAENTLYSGTIGAAIEGALHGVRSIALSQYFGPGNAGLDNPFEAAAEYGADLIQRLVDGAEWQDQAYGLFYNVNFPPHPAAEVKGVRAVRQGFREETNFTVEPHFSPSGRKFLWVKGGPQHGPAGANSDASVNLEGYISVTPMRADLTDHQMLARTQDLFDR